MKVFVCTDAHYGLKSAGMDRTEEIHAIMMGIVSRAIDEGADFFIHMGDLGQTANPTSRVHRCWIEVFNALEDAGIHSRFLLGNHDIVNHVENQSGNLGPLEKLGLKFVHCVDLASLELTPDDRWVFMFLPFVSKSMIPGKERNTYYREHVKGFIGASEDRNLIVFTHLNVDGATVADDWLLRPVDAVMPRSLYQEDRVKLILSGHIHKPQTIRKSDPRHEILGSLISTDFGDVAEKRYATLDIKGNRCRVKFHLTGCVPLVELKYDLVGMLNPILTIPEAVDGAGVKVRIRCTEDQLAFLDLQEFANELGQRAMFYRPIVPTIVREEVGKIDAKQIVKPGMTDTRMISNWIAKKKPPQAKRIAELATEALGEEP